MLQIVPSLWFGDNNCEEAVNDYVTIFPNSRISQMVYYPNENLNEHFVGMAGKVITAEFYLNGQKFIGLDGGPIFHFSEAISFTIECQNQAEIDYYWEKLSHVPESEQCGWVKDRYGLSWQIVPNNIAELQQTDAQIKALMSMKKIIISELEAAK
ncbi:VOC family protein [Fundicoccus ignavus]|uniref:VOC family protein n=1 Tax=Fundicoccus ignavus TaxID=2664442 RepID=A0A844C0B4_9LACT|nr:VOC family protein [Fundicoccus ignavus]MRJ47634.1 VOC family protein [Fundicoccus ignavus]